MKIMFFCPGTSIKSWAGLIKALDRNLKTNNSDFLLVSPKYAENIIREMNIPYQVLPSLSIGKKLEHAALDIIIGNHIEKLIKGYKPDVIHVMGEASYFITYKLAQIKKKFSFILTCRAAQNVNQIWPFPFSYFEKQALNSLDAIFSVNKDAENVLRQKGFKGIIEYLPNGYDADIFAGAEPRLPKLPLKLIYVGNFMERKGLRYLMEACCSIKDLPWRLTMVGSGPLEKYLRTTIEENSLGEKINIIGRLSQEELASVYNDADVLVLPSIDSDGSDHSIGKKIKWLRVKWKEQFGRVLVEAMRYSIPAIGSDCGAIPEVIGDAGWIVPQKNSQKLAEVISYLISNIREVYEKGIIAKKRSRLYSWDVVSQQLIHYWNQLITTK